MTKIVEIERKIITLFYNDNIKVKNIPVIILNTFDEDGQEIWDRTKEISCNDYCLVTISNINWNKEMSPWYMQKLFKSEDDYTGGADNYIDTLTKKIIPQIDNAIKDIFDGSVSEYIIAGYSLAGLFAIYSLYKTNIFTSVISCSGSLWYPDFVEYIQNNELKIKPHKIYFSLGNKEKNTKNELMSKVEEKTKFTEQYFKKRNIETIYEENEGNHFQDVTNRIAKSIKWILD